MGDMIVRLVDGVGIVVDRADDSIEVSDELLMNPDERFLTFDGSVLTVAAANGTWRYERRGIDLGRRVHTFDRLR